MKKTTYLLVIAVLLLTLAFSLNDFSLAVFGVGKYTDVDNVGNIGLYSNTPSYEFSASSTVYIAASEVNNQKISSVKFSLYLNYSSSPISGFSDIPIEDNGVAPDVLANDGVFTYSLDLSTISSLKHNDFITVKVTTTFADGSTVNREVRFLIDKTMDFNTYKIGNIRSAVFNSGEKLNANFINYTSIESNSDNPDLINTLKVSQLNDSSNTIQLNNIKRNTFFVKISDPSNPSDASNPDGPIFAAPHFSVANLNAVKYAYSGAWTENIISGSNSYVRKDYIKYLSFNSSEPSRWWKITALGKCPSPLSPPATMTFRLVDSNNTTIASFTGPAKSEDVELQGGNTKAIISVGDPSKLATKTETTMLYIEEFSENFMLDFKPHIYGVNISQNPTYNKDNVDISFYNDFNGSVDFIVYNDKGKIVYTSSKNVTSSGTSIEKQNFIWNFKDLNNKRVPSGEKYYFKILPFVVDTSSNETIYGPFVYGSILLKLPIGKITGINPNTLKNGQDLNYSFNISEPATVSVLLTHENKTYYNYEEKIGEPGDYTNSFTIPSSAVDGIYTFQFKASTSSFETDDSTEVIIDNTPPILNFSLSQVGTSIIIDGRTDTNIKGINLTYELYKSQPNNLILLKTLTKVSTDGKINEKFTDLQNGYYVVNVKAKDPVGNYSSLKKGIGLGGNGEVLSQGSTITTFDGKIKIVIPENATSNNYIVNISEESSNDSIVYKISPSISLTKFATLTLTLDSTPSESNLFLVSEYNGIMNLMTLLSSKTNIVKLKNIEKLTIKTVQSASKLQISYDKMVYTAPLKIFINNYESLTVSIFVLDLRGNLVKILAENTFGR
jgi:hypothetical protein